MAFPIAARFAHPGNGYKGDQELAAKHLTVGKVYTLTGIDVGRSSSSLFLDIPDGPACGFNTVMFDPASVFDQDDEPQPAHVASPDADGCDSAAEITRLRNEIAKHRTRLAMLLADTPFEFRPDWEAEYDDAAPEDGLVLPATPAEPKPAPELAAAMAETARFRNWLDDFTHVVIDLGEARVVRAAERVRTKAGLPPVKP